MGTVWAIAIISVVALTLVAYFASRTPPATPASSQIVASPPSQVLDPDKLAPSVLTLYCYDKSGKSIGQGSGFVLRQDGVAVTDWHVAKNAYSIVAADGAGRSYKVSRYLNVDPNSDLVLLQLVNQDGSEPTLPAIPVADSRKVSPGLKIYTISAPEGFSHTLSDGLLSALRSVEGTQLLQITAPVSPGSSGGPVLNAAGEVVGVIEGLIPSGQQLNFAIPIDAAIRLLNGAAAYVPHEPSTDANARQRVRQNEAAEFERGRTALGQKDYALAARIFTTYLTAHPQETAAAYNAALAFVGLNDFEKATAFFKTYLRLASDDDEGVDAAKKWIAAFEQASTATQATPESTKASQSSQQNRSLVGRYQLVGSVDGARASLKLSIASDLRTSGQLSIDGVLDQVDVTGAYQPQNGTLYLRVSNGQAFMGTFDGRKFSGTFNTTGNGDKAESGAFEFRLQVKY